MNRNEMDHKQLYDELSDTESYDQIQIGTNGNWINWRRFTHVSSVWRNREGGQANARIQVLLDKFFDDYVKTINI